MVDRSQMKGLHRAVTQQELMPTYISREGVEVSAYNTLTEERELELREHLDNCDTALQQCPECWLLYVSIGQDEYVKALSQDL